MQAWSPWNMADKEVLEKVQMRAIRQVSGLRSQDYGGQLKELGLVTLEERRHQADMALVFKELTGNVDTEFFQLASGGNRVTRLTSDPLNVKINHCRLDVRRNFFSVRVAQQWNSIPSSIKQSGSIGSFKKAYMKYREE